jgi:hypothetical protein
LQRRHGFADSCRRYHRRRVRPRLDPGAEPERLGISDLCGRVMKSVREVAGPPGARRSQAMLLPAFLVSVRSPRPASGSPAAPHGRAAVAGQLPARAPPGDRRRRSPRSRGRTCERLQRHLPPAGRRERRDPPRASAPDMRSGSTRAWSRAFRRSPTATPSPSRSTSGLRRRQGGSGRAHARRRDRGAVRGHGGGGGAGEGGRELDRQRAPAGAEGARDRAPSARRS